MLNVSQLMCAVDLAVVNRLEQLRQIEAQQRSSRRHRAGPTSSQRGTRVILPNGQLASNPTKLERAFNSAVRTMRRCRLPLTRGSTASSLSHGALRLQRNTSVGADILFHRQREHSVEKSNSKQPKPLLRRMFTF
mmetsp:Transcript_78694/g.156474  ORF Transcript_78694/g.156474 Transcript_78694/m.156474 type:complete len:135 (-) Transcript_78694:587-991(-)|eukprot:CAMPEP_0174717452 /NCGR_PEP_ID=MMETSP1094-20130205/26437_1 /TAXON_ID=156173 /ORGANISM="Chrysochromulina brevifilum, Strain UTEX LB 985" /LENGTH=134 /DNA_ID=CAMNT_0015917377 /DNA_START=49 /DNA_END=453 /DNA_ORIENTATION=-